MEKIYKNLPKTDTTIWPLSFFTVRTHEPIPSRENFETNFEISQSQVEI